MFLSSFVFQGFCHVFVNVFVWFLFSFLFLFFHVFKLRSFNSQLHSALSVVNHHAFGQEVGNYCPLTEPIRFQDPQDTARS